MGLFGSKNKEEMTAKLTDFFSAEDLLKIKEVVSPKRAGHMYGKYTGEVDDLMNAVDNAEKPYGKRDLKTILFSVGCMTKIEPSLIQVLTPAIEKLRAFMKQ